MTGIFQGIILPRGDTAANLAASNIIPLDGERVRETDTGREKTGDGTTHYNDLPYDPSIADLAATSTKVEARWAARNPGRGSVPKSRTTYYDKADTAYASLPTSMDTGEAITYSVAGSAAPVISGGAFSLPRGAVHSTKASYTNFDAGSGNQITRIAMKLRARQDGSATTLGHVWNVAMTNGAYVGAGGTAFRIGAHLSITYTGWALTQMSNASGSLVTTATLSTGTFKTPLKYDSVTEYTLEIYRAGTTLTMFMPDGQRIVVTDSNIGAWSGQYGWAELYQTFSDTDMLPQMTEVWYDTGTQVIPGESGLVKREDITALKVGRSISAADYTDGTKNFIGWSHDIVNNFGGVQLSAGVQSLIMVPNPETGVITNVIAYVQTAGSGLTSGQCFAGLYQNGTLLGTTADMSTAWGSVGMKIMPLSTPVAVAGGSPVHVCLMANGTTRPTFAMAISGSASPIVLANPTGLKRYAYDATNTGRTTSLSASLGTLNDYSPIWAATS